MGLFTLLSSHRRWTGYCIVWQFAVNQSIFDTFYRTCYFANKALKTNRLLHWRWNAAYLIAMDGFQSHARATLDANNTNHPPAITTHNQPRWSAAVSALVVLHDKPCDGKAPAPIGAQINYSPSAIAIKPKHLPQLRCVNLVASNRSLLHTVKPCLDFLVKPNNMSVSRSNQTHGHLHTKVMLCCFSNPRIASSFFPGAVLTYPNLHIFYSHLRTDSSPRAIGWLV
jgi:hypothetical protein